MMNRITHRITTLEMPPHSNERELYYSLMEKLNEVLIYMEHDGLNLSQAEISDINDTLSLISMSLNNCE